MKKWLHVDVNYQDNFVTGTTVTVEVFIFGFSVVKEYHRFEWGKNKMDFIVDTTIDPILKVKCKHEWRQRFDADNDPDGYYCIHCLDIGYD